MNTIRTISRLLVGFVFIFSGFVKGVDPLGTAFKIEDYLLFYQMDWLIPMKLALSIFLSSVEFACGMLLVLNVKPKWNTWLVFLMMSFFTVLTFYDAIYEPVKDCGCFGDAIILTNWQTFYKNVVLMVPTLIIFIQRGKLKTPFNPVGEWALLAGVPVLFAWFSITNFNNLPLIDFLAWKTGNKVTPDRSLPLQVTLTYRNVNTGEEQQFISPNFPFNDPEWLAQWEFVSQCVVDPNPPPSHNLQILDSDMSDMTENFISNPDFQFILVVWDSKNVNTAALNAMNKFYHRTETDGHSFIAIAPTIDEGNELRKALKLDYEFYFADDVELKIMVRSNPGLLLMKDGVVLAKWSYRNFPDYDEVEKTFLKAESAMN